MHYLFPGILPFLVIFFQPGYAQALSKKVSKEVYVCTPCGYDCDKEEFTGSGICKHCNMKLVKRGTIVFGSLRLADLCAFMKKHPKTILLDVRTREEFDGTAPDKFGRLRNAINIPVQELEKRIGELEKYKKKEILVYCSHSHRSPQSSYILNQHGFTKVTNMLGGMSVWDQEVKDPPCSEMWLVK